MQTCKHVILALCRLSQNQIVQGHLCSVILQEQELLACSICAFKQDAEQTPLTTSSVGLGIRQQLILLSYCGKYCRV